jgi:hypothetical protein
MPMGGWKIKCGLHTELLVPILEKFPSPKFQNEIPQRSYIIPSAKICWAELNDFFFLRLSFIVLY